MEFNLAAQVFLAVGLAVIMFSIGLSLTRRDFAQLVEAPRGVFAGLVGQLLGLPLAALLVVHLFGLSDKLAVGMLIIAFCPGGPTSNLFSFLARANVALSVSLTAILSVVTVFTIPVVLGFTANHFLGTTQEVSIPIVQTFLQLVGMVLIPMFLGMLFRNYQPALSVKMQPATSQLSLLLLLVLIIYVFSKNYTLFAGDIALLAASLTAMFLFSTAFAIAVSYAFSLSFKDRKTVMIEVGIQNGAQAIVIASSPLILNSPEMAIPAALYSMMMYIFVAGLYVVFRQMEKK